MRNAGQIRTAMMKGLALAGLLMTISVAPLAAQRPPSTPPKPPAAAPRVPGRTVVAMTVGMHVAPKFDHDFTFTANAEEGTIEAAYPSATSLLFDGSIGYKFWRRAGLAVGGSLTSGTGGATLRASVPHPLLLDNDRLVEGEAADLSRTESAAHVQVFYEIAPRGKWRARVFAGPSYFWVSQDLVQNVTVDEAYPFDTATFRSAVTGEADGSGIGFNVGADIAWMFSRRAGAGFLLRYAGAPLDLNAPDSGNVSTDAGGFQAGAGLRFLF